MDNNNIKNVNPADLAFMDLALAEAEKAAAAGDVPVGAVLVRNGEVLSAGHNTREADRTALGHAEINAISDACRALGSWRLSGCTLYVTLEPCPMCAGAILGGRVSRVVCGTRDPAAGAMGSVWAIHRHPVQTVPVTVEYGCREEECRALLRDFFRSRRAPDDGKESGL
ncbi:MAG: nucleoside deaminase [Clostridia bacterium]|nr:nucleoside deaminase [Clostridia bacterium]